MALNYTSHLQVGFEAAPTALKKAEATGYVVNLMATRQRGFESSVTTLLYTVQPAIQQRRIKVFFNEDGQSVGYAIWATLDPEVEERVLAQSAFHLHESEWNEGTHWWMVDLVVLPGHLRNVLRNLRDDALAQVEEISYLRRRGSITLRKQLRRSTRLGFFRTSDAAGAAANEASNRLPALQVSRHGACTLAELAKPLLDVPFSETDDADLAPLAAAIGEAKMVVLGSQTHGDGNGLALKARIVRHLCRHKGFRVLTIESGSFDIECAGAQVDDGSASFGEALKGAMFYMYAHSEQLRDFFDFLEHERRQPNGLRTRGFHSKHTGRFSHAQLCSNLRQWLRASGHNPLSEAEWKQFTPIVQSVIEMSEKRPASDVLTWYEGCISRLLTSIEKVPDHATNLLESSAYWKRTLNEISRQGRRYWKIHDDWAARERGLAEYLMWLSERFHSGEKVIVWTHNIHTIRHAKAYMMAGSLAESLGNQLVSIGFTGNHGHFTEWGSGKMLQISPASPGSLEYALGQTGHATAWVDVRLPETQAALAVHQAWRYRHYTQADFPVSESFDLMISHNDVSPTVLQGIKL